MHQGNLLLERTNLRSLILGEKSGGIGQNGVRIILMDNTVITGATAKDVEMGMAGGMVTLADGVIMDITGATKIRDVMKVEMEKMATLAMVMMEAIHGTITGVITMIETVTEDSIGTVILGLVTAICLSAMLSLRLCSSASLLSAFLA
jgi:hypothetical protein